MSFSGFSASRSTSWAQTRLAVTWSMALPMKTMRSFRSSWKTRPDDSRSGPAAVTRGVSDAVTMATRLVGGEGDRRHAAVHSLFTRLAGRCGRGGIGRRAGFRSRSPKGGGGSNPLARTGSPPAPAPDSFLGVPHLVAAPDKFRGTASALDVARAVAE